MTSMARSSVRATSLHPRALPLLYHSLSCSFTTELTSSSSPNLTPRTFEKAKIDTYCNDNLYYTYVVDESLRVRYTSLGQESAERSLEVVLELVREDVMVEESEEESDDEESDDDEVEDDSEADDEGEAGYEGEGDYKEYDDMDMD
jgi:hypothetical protein